MEPDPDMPRLLYEFALWVGMFGMLTLVIGEARMEGYFRKRFERMAGLILFCSIMAVLVVTMAEAW